MISPTLTIIMATYNRAHFIVEPLKSIQAQTFSDWECLIIDDGGTDNTKEVITSILEQDQRFQYVKRPDSYVKGLPGCRNYGLDLAQGKYIIFFDDDDIVHPENLKIGIEVVETNNVDFCHYQKLSFRNEKPIINNDSIAISESLTLENIKKVVTQEIGLASCTVLWKKRCFEKIRFNESLMYAEEWECFTKIISKNFNGLIISNVLYYNKKHPNSNTGEFFNNNPIRRESYVRAILLVMQNLKEKKILSNSLNRYFITLSLGFQEYDLFNTILNFLEFSTYEKLKWHIYYRSYFLRLPIYKLKKGFK